MKKIKFLLVAFAVLSFVSFYGCQSTSNEEAEDALNELMNDLDNAVNELEAETEEAVEDMEAVADSLQETVVEENAEETTE